MSQMPLPSNWKREAPVPDFKVHEFDGEKYIVMAENQQASTIKVLKTMIGGLLLLFLVVFYLIHHDVMMNEARVIGLERYKAEQKAKEELKDAGWSLQDSAGRLGTESDSGGSGEQRRGTEVSRD